MASTKAKTKTPAPATPQKTSQAIDSKDSWRGFEPGLWQRDVNVRWFIQRNYTPYDGDGQFLAPATERSDEECSVRYTAR